MGATREEPTGRPGTTILYDEYGVAHISGRTRADLAFGAGWVTARDRGLLLQARSGTGASCRRRHPGHRRLRAGDQPSVVRPQRSHRAARLGPGGSPRRDLRRQGPPDHRRRPGRGRRHQCLLGGPRDRPAAGHGQRRRRGDVVHRVDLRRRRGRRGRQRRAAGEAAGGARSRAGEAGVGRCHARRRSRGAHHDQAALQVRATDRRQGHRFGGGRPRVDPVARPAAAGAGGLVGVERRGGSTPPIRRRGPCPPERRRTSCWSTRRDRPPATRSPSWAPSSGTSIPRSCSRSTSADLASRPRAWRCPPPPCTSSSGAPRTTPGASPRPTTTCATCSPSSCATPTARRPPASRPTTCSRARASRSRCSTPAR